jgi:hypothetical protein
VPAAPGIAFAAALQRLVEQHTPEWKAVYEAGRVSAHCGDRDLSMRAMPKLIAGLIMGLLIAPPQIRRPAILPREPISVPFSVAEKGFSITTDFAAVKRKYRYLFSLDLVLEKNNEEQFQQVAKLWGGPSSFDRETFEYKPMGIPIPVRLTVSRIDGKEEAIVYGPACSGSRRGEFTGTDSRR